MTSRDISNIKDSFLTQSGIGIEDHTSSHEVFHNTIIDNEINQRPNIPTNFNSISEFEDNMNLLSAKNIPELLKLILSYTNVNNREIYHTPSNFRIFSISQIIKNLNNNQKCIDFGYFSMGMGHAVTISWIIDTGKCFLRPDGGSNGYDAYYTQKVGNTIDPSTGSFISIDFKSNGNTGISKQTNMIVFDIKDFLQYLINKEYIRNRFGVITFPDNFKPINIY